MGYSPCRCILKKELSETKGGVGNGGGKGFKMVKHQNKWRQRCSARSFEIFVVIYINDVRWLDIICRIFILLPWSFWTETNNNIVIKNGNSNHWPNFSLFLCFIPSPLHYLISFILMFTFALVIIKYKYGALNINVHLQNSLICLGASPILNCNLKWNCHTL